MSQFFESGGNGLEFQLQHQSCPWTPRTDLLSISVNGNFPLVGVQAKNPGVILGSSYPSSDCFSFQIMFRNCSLPPWFLPCPNHRHPSPVWRPQLHDCVCLWFLQSLLSTLAGATTPCASHIISLCLGIKDKVSLRATGAHTVPVYALSLGLLRTPWSPGWSSNLPGTPRPWGIGPGCSLCLLGSGPRCPCGWCSRVLQLVPNVTFSVSTPSKPIYNYNASPHPIPLNPQYAFSISIAFVAS